MSDLHPQVLELLASLSTNPPAQPWEVSITAYRAVGEKLIGLAGDLNPHCDVRDLEIPPSREGPQCPELLSQRHNRGSAVCRVLPRWRFRQGQPGLS